MKLPITLLVEPMTLTLLMPDTLYLHDLMLSKFSVAEFFPDFSSIVLSVIPHLILLFSVLDGDRPF